MHLFADDYTGLRQATLDMLAEDISALADVFLKQADVLWDDMVRTRESWRVGKRYTIRRIDLPKTLFSRILVFEDHSGSGGRVVVIVAMGKDYSGREVIAWAEDTREARSLQNPLKHLAMESTSEAFENLRGSHCIALSRLPDGKWCAETPLLKYDIRAGMTQYVLDWETPDGSGDGGVHVPGTSEAP